MATRYTDDFHRDAVRIATSSGLTRPKVALDLGVELSPLNYWVQKHQHNDLMSGPHEDVKKENERLHTEVRLLREERGGAKKGHHPLTYRVTQARLQILLQNTTGLNVKAATDRYV